MNITTFVYALHMCAASYSQKTVFVDLFDCAKTKGRICYFSTQFEDWRPDAKDFPKDALGKPLGDWKGERYADYRNAKVKAIMQKRMDKAKSKHCAGIDPDNVDIHTHNTGFKLTAKDQRTFIEFLSKEAKKRGLLIGLKNSSETAKALSPLVDFHVVEECTKYKECGKYPQSKSFFIEYTKRSDAVCKLRPYTVFADQALKKMEWCK